MPAEIMHDLLCKEGHFVKVYERQNPAPISRLCSKVGYCVGLLIPRSRVRAPSEAA